jgi:hypothetical protein
VEDINLEPEERDGGLKRVIIGKTDILRNALQI